MTERNTPDEQAVAEALGVPTASVSFGPSAESFRPLDPDNRDGPWRWQAVGPRGVAEGIAPSYTEAREAVRAADVCRRSQDEDATMPKYLTLEEKYRTPPHNVPYGERHGI